MKQWLRRLKAAVTLGGFWGAASGGVAAACQVVLQALGGGVAWNLVLQSGLLFGLCGWLVGSAFAGTLISFEARGILGRMQSWRIALWGALMGGVLAPLLGALMAGPATLTPLGLAGLAGLGLAIGASLSTGTLRVAESVSRELSAGRSVGRLGDDEPRGLAPGER